MLGNAHVALPSRTPVHFDVKFSVDVKCSVDVHTGVYFAVEMVNDRWNNTPVRWASGEQASRLETDICSSSERMNSTPTSDPPWHVLCREADGLYAY